MQELDERKYIESLKRGSREAFDGLYKLYCRRLFSYCYQYTKSKEDTEDIVQDVFVKLWTQRDTIREEDTIVYFLFRIMKNTLINRYRSMVNSPVYEEYVSMLHEQMIASSGNKTSEAVEYDDFKNTLESVIRKLPETQEPIIKYRLFHDLSIEEIADKLHLSEQTIRNQSSIAFKTIREKISKQYLVWILAYLLFVIKQ